ncbi:MAG: hypothetical protein ACM31C_11485 [Acidobacteriota bacterium]
MTARCALVLAVAGCSFHRGNTGLSPGDAPDAIDAAGDAREIDAASWLDAPLAVVSFVQSAGADGATTDVSATLPGARAAGDLYVVAISWPDPSISLVSVADTDLNSFQQVGTGIALTGHGVLAVYVAANLGAATTPDVVSATLSASTSGTLVVAEYRGLDPTNPIEGTASSSDTTGTAADSGPYATAHAHDLVVGAMCANRSFAAGAGFTSRVDQSSTMIEDHEVLVAASYDGTATLSSSGAWFARVIALRAAD